MSEQPIENHGDLYTFALVAADGTIDFMCLPAFDTRAQVPRRAARATG